MIDFRTKSRRARPAVPAHLLHVVVELHGVPVGVDGEGAVVDAGEQLRRQMLDRDTLALEEGDPVAQLLVIADLHAEREERGMWTKTELAPQSDRIEREG